MITLDQAKGLKSGQHIVWYSANKKKLITLKINGMPKIWKRQPEKIQIPVKYGLYEYGYLYENDLQAIDHIE